MLCADTDSLREKLVARADQTPLGRAPSTWPTNDQRVHPDFAQDDVIPRFHPTQNRASSLITVMSRVSMRLILFRLEQPGITALAKREAWVSLPQMNNSCSTPW
jgi:hypothetical protein